MTNIRLEKIRDYDGDIDGYKLGSHYLMKHWGGEHTYTWIINSTGETSYWHNEFWRLEESGEIEICENFKEGKARLIELYEQEEQK